MESAEKTVYRITDGYVTIAGIGKIAVTSFMLILEHNGIPVLRLNIVPRLYIPAKPSKDGHADVTSLDDFVEAYNQLTACADDANKRVSSFYFKAVSTSGDTQVLDLKGWLLTSVGYPSLSASGTFQLSLELCHPAKLINECAISFFGMEDHSVGNQGDSIDAGTIYEGINQVLELYHTSASVATGEESSDAYALMLARFSQAKDAFKKYMTWSGAVGWPYGPLPELKSVIPRALWDYVWGLNSITLWDWLSNRIVSDWFLSIRPTYWQDALTMEPSEPWRESRLEISSDDISDIALPAANPQNLSGAVARSLSPISSTFTAFANSLAYKKGSTGGGAHVEKLSVGGALLQFEPPAWYFRCLTLASLAAPGSTPGGTNNSSTPLNAMSSTASSSEISTDWTPFLGIHTRAFAKEYFVQSYKRFFEATITTRLILRYRGGYTHAGYVQSVTTPSGGILLKYFATRVIHAVDCISKQAYTQITGTYLRTKASPILEAIPGGTVGNSLYAETKGGKAAAGSGSRKPQNYAGGTVMGPNGPVAVGDQGS